MTSPWYWGAGGCSAPAVSFEHVTHDMSGRSTHPQWLPFWGNCGVIRRGVPATTWGEKSFLVFCSEETETQREGCGFA